MPDPTRMLEEISGEAAFSLIPQELKDIRIWLLWKLETRDGKSTKVPYQVSGRYASATNSNTWTSFSEALRVFNTHPTVYSGIGFAIVPRYTGVDFDKCRDPETGAVTKLATDAIAALHSYTEISQSGRGFHVIVKGTLPLGCKTEEIEVYPGRRYFTATGLHVNETPKVINECDMPSFRDTFMPKAGKDKREPNPAKDSFDRLSDAVAEKNGGNRWAPFERRVGGDFVLPDPGQNTSCPMHVGHTSCLNFGIMKGDPRRLCCNGTNGVGLPHGWDLVQIVFDWDNMADVAEGRPPRYQYQYDAARALCLEEGLDFNTFFPPQPNPYSKGAYSTSREACFEKNRAENRYENPLTASGSVVTTEEPILSAEEIVYPDLPEDAVGDGALADICRSGMNNFSRAYAWNALLTVAGTMVPLAAVTGDEESLVVSVRRSNQTNLYTALIGGIHTGKTLAIQYAMGHLRLPTTHYSDTKAGSIEGLLAKLEDDEAGRQMLIDLDEWSHLFKKAGIDNASFIDILNSGYNKTHYRLTIARGRRINLDCALTLIGGVVLDNVQECFGNSTTGGFHDRFLFGVCPTNNPFQYEPFEALATSAPLEPCEVAIDPDVWQLTKQWNRDDPTLGRSVEVMVRCASIVASFDGRKILLAKDVERMRPFLDYQSRCRALITPNPGTTNDAQMCNAIRAWLNRHAPSGEWITMRGLKKGIHRQLDTLGAAAFVSAIKFDVHERHRNG